MAGQEELWMAGHREKKQPREETGVYGSLRVNKVAGFR